VNAYTDLAEASEILEAKRGRANAKASRKVR
jgi:hypothetical protein